MTLRNIKNSEYFQFDDAASLRDWLNKFKDTDLDTLYFEDTLTLHYQTEILSDDSEVNNIRVS